MSFLKISDPLKRDAIVKEYLELKKKIRDNLLSERIGEQQLQTDLSKFYKPITETQKATTREITEGLKPISEELKPISKGLKTIRKEIYDIPDIILGREAIERYEKELEEEKEEKEEEEEDEEEEDESVGEIARNYLNKPDTDKIFGVRKEKGHHYIGNQHVVIEDDNIILSKNWEKFEGTQGLWELIMSKNPKNFTDKDYDNYEDLMIMTNALHRGNDEDNPHPKGNYKSYKWRNILRPIWYRKKSRIIFPEKKEKQDGSGVVVIPSDPNALLERLDLLLASQEAGHTGVRNELVSICDELKRQGVLDMKAYKKLNHIIKK